MNSDLKADDPEEVDALQTASSDQVGGHDSDEGIPNIAFETEETIETLGCDNGDSDKAPVTPVTVVRGHVQISENVDTDTDENDTEFSSSENTMRPGKSDAISKPSRGKENPLSPQTVSLSMSKENYGSTTSTTTVSSEHPNTVASKPSSGVTMENGGAVNLLPTDKCSLGKDAESPTENGPRIYKRRWLMLGIFCAYSFSNAYQWIHLNIIANIMLRYYNESLPASQYEAEVAVDWLSMVYMLAYIPLILPATWLLDKKGLRVSSIIATLLNCLGAWLKCLSVTPDRFPVLMVAQTICAVAQLFVLGIPPRLAAVWFSLDEVSTATSLGVFGNQVGVAVGFLIPPEIVPNSDDLSVVGRDLRIMMYSTAGVTTALFLIVLIFFKERPPRPPSRAQQMAVQSLASTDYIQSLKNLFRRRGFILLVFAYGFNTGCFYAVSTLLNTLVLRYFKDQEQSAGRIGLTIVLAGVLGAVVAGIWLDKTKTYKGTTLSIYIMSCACMAAFTFTMGLERIWVVYITAGTLGFFMTGYLPVGFEYAAEITYPEPEGTSSGLLNASAQVCGIALTLGMRAMINKVDVLYANITMTAALFIGIILTAFICSKYRRQAAERDAQSVDIEIIDEEVS